MSLAGKVALITGELPSAQRRELTCRPKEIYLLTPAGNTGSTQGIGLGMLKGLARAGANVVMHGLLPAEQASQRCQELGQEFGVRVGHSAADVTHPQQIRFAPRADTQPCMTTPASRLTTRLLALCCCLVSRICGRDMISQVQQDFGALDILCNNVGIQHVAPVHEFPDDKWDAMIAITLSSAFHTTKAALPAMLDKQWGRIINTGSMHALVASPYKSAYNAAKHGIAGAQPRHSAGCCRMPLDAQDTWLQGSQRLWVWRWRRKETSPAMLSAQATCLQARPAQHDTSQHSPGSSAQLKRVHACRPHQEPARRHSQGSRHPEGKPSHANALACSPKHM